MRCQVEERKKWEELQKLYDASGGNDDLAEEVAAAGRRVRAIDTHVELKLHQQAYLVMVLEWWPLRNADSKTPRAEKRSINYFDNRCCIGT